MKNQFSGLNSHMRIEILIDPETKEYQFDVDGSLSLILSTLKQVVKDLEDPDILNQLTLDPN